MKTVHILALSLLFMSALPALSQVDEDLEIKKSFVARVEEEFTKLSPDKKKERLQYERYQFFNACGEIVFSLFDTESGSMRDVIQDSLQHKVTDSGIRLHSSAPYEIRLTLLVGPGEYAGDYFTEIEFRRPLHDLLTGLSYMTPVWEYSITGSVPGNQILHAHHLVDVFLQQYWRANAKCRTPFSSASTPNRTAP